MAIAKNANETATIVLFSFLNPTIPTGIPISANVIFGSSHLWYSGGYPAFILNINK